MLTVFLTLSLLILAAINARSAYKQSDNRGLAFWSMAFGAAGTMFIHDTASLIVRSL